MRGASRRVATALLAVATLLASGCTSDDGGAAGSPSSDPHPDISIPPECEIAIPVPDGFKQISHRHVEYEDHVGSRLRFQGGGDRALFYNAGIPGEFAEGAEPRGIVSVLDGREGNLYGAGSVWIITWDEGGPCGDNVVIGNGFGKRDFVATMTQASVLNAGD